MNSEEFAYIADIPDRMVDLWDWVVALTAWDYGDPTLLAELLGNEPIPPEFIDALKSIVSGNRQINKKAASKLKIPAGERVKVAAYCRVFIGAVKYIRDESTEPLAPTGMNKGVSAVAWRSGVEPVEVRRAFELEIKNEYIRLANEWGVSVETIENLVRDLHKKISQWPVV